MSESNNFINIPIEHLISFANTEPVLVIIRDVLRVNSQFSLTHLRSLMRSEFEVKESLLNYPIELIDKLIDVSYIIKNQRELIFNNQDVFEKKNINIFKNNLDSIEEDSDDYYKEIINSFKLQTRPPKSGITISFNLKEYRGLVKLTQLQKSHISSDQFISMIRRKKIV